MVVDASAHNCVQDGARLSGLPILSFASGDARALRSVLSNLPPSARPLVATDGVYGIRGGMAPLNEYLIALPASGWLWVDDAHGLGSVGATGRGSPEFLASEIPELSEASRFQKHWPSPVELSLATPPLWNTFALELEPIWDPRLHRWPSLRPSRLLWSGCIGFRAASVGCRSSPAVFQTRCRLGPKSSTTPELR